MEETEFDAGYEDAEPEGEDYDLDYGEETYEDEAVETEENPWSWADEEGVDPAAVKKTWTQYTQTREEALAEKREAERLRSELEPISRLREEIMNDPGLVEVIQNYMTSGGRPAEREVADIKRELTGMKQQIMTERELNDLHSWAKERDYPDFDDVEVLQYASSNRIGNLRAAYSDMNIEAIQNARADKVVSGIKKSRGAKTLKTKGESTKKSGFSEKDLLSMSDEDFVKNYDAILEGYQPKE